MPLAWQNTQEQSIFCVWYHHPSYITLRLFHSGTKVKRVNLGIGFSPTVHKSVPLWNLLTLHSFSCLADLYPFLRLQYSSATLSWQHWSSLEDSIPWPLIDSDLLWYHQRVQLQRQRDSLDVFHCIFIVIWKPHHKFPDHLICLVALLL